MFKKITAILLCTVTIFTLSACGSSISHKNKSSAQAQTGTESNSGKIKVSVTFDAMKELVKAIGKDKVSISTIIPDGTEPHDFEPKARDLVNLSSAKLFVYNGLGMESWVTDAIKSVNNKNLITVDASASITPIANTNKGETSKHGQYDPHIWLSLTNAKLISKSIADALSKIDPSNQSYYEANYNNFSSKSDALSNEYAQKFATVSNKSFVTGHAAFAYLCRDFGLTQNSVEDVFAEGEPSAKQLVNLVTYCKENHVTTIFAEELASPEVSKTLADEVGAKVKTIYTIESREDGKSYLDRMQDNLSEIYESLSK